MADSVDVLRDDEASSDAGHGLGLRVLVADHDPLVCRLVCRTVQEAGMNVIAATRTGCEAVRLALLLRPELVVIDDMLAGIDGIEATRRIHADEPSIAVVVLTSPDEELAVRALRAGATGYLSKQIEPQKLPRALRGALAGEAAISRRLAMTLVERVRAAAPTNGAGLRPVRSPLTAREWEVLDLLVSGVTTERIAEQLVLSTETIRSHVKDLYRKLDVHSRGDAVQAASRLRTRAA